MALECLALDKTFDLAGDNYGAERPYETPVVSLVLAGLNEAAIVEKNLSTLCEFMESLEPTLEWEMVFVNDGSTDGTAEIVEEFAASRHNIRVLHHDVNRGLGQSLRYAFSECRGDYIITLDVDLSFGPEHIPLLLDKIRKTGAKIVASSPYMRGGSFSNVPWLRKFLTIWSNRFLSLVAKRDVSSITPMVRAYDRHFIQALDLRSTGMDINVEIMHKAMILDVAVAEIPSHLDWSLQLAEGDARQSKMKIMRHTMAVLLSGFLFRPFIFFVLPGLASLLLSIYANFWMIVHVIEEYSLVDPTIVGMDRFDAAVAAAFHVAPHTFVVGGMTLVVAIQLISLGIVALQNTNYFEQVFHLGTTILRGQVKTAEEYGA